jgi:hypothetical protein
MKKYVKKGFSESKLLNLCSDKNNRSIFRWASWAPYWTAEIYSFGKHIRKYGYYPSFLPLCIYTDHGPDKTDYPLKHELESDAPVMFYHSSHSADIWKKFSERSCYTLYSPFVYCRRKNNIRKSPSAKGTIAFYSHSTESIDNLLDPKIYIKQLLDLPAVFQPVSVCLHHTDINKGIYKIFLEHNIPVYTAGGLGPLFAERFYNILRNFSFATSNMVGSYLYYAVEIGLPFSIYGSNPKFINRNNDHFKIGKWDPYQEFVNYRQVYNLFRGLNTKISVEQKTTVEDGLGINNGVSRCKMAIILYQSFFKWFFSPRFGKWVSAEFLKVKKYFKLNR